MAASSHARLTSSRRTHRAQRRVAEEFQLIETDRTKYRLKLALFIALALLPVVGGFLFFFAIHIGGLGGYLLVICSGLLIVALPFGKCMLLPTTTLEHMYRGWILRRLNNSSKS